jgi:hypothetical protein
MNSMKAQPVVPWWLWPNLLSLDAPLVAWLWQRLLAQSFGAGLSMASQVALVLAVWLIYLTDRWLDSWRECSTVRHQFYRQHRGLILGLMVVGGVGALMVTFFYLEPPIRATGLKLSVVVGLYLGLVQTVTLSRGGKELLVGLLFTAGTSLSTYVVCSPLPWRFWLIVTFFAGLCAINCRLIEQREKSDPQCPASSVRVLSWGIVVILGFLLWSLPEWTYFPCLTALALSALALGWIELKKQRLTVEAYRVWADAALWTPVFFLHL